MDGEARDLAAEAPSDGVTHRRIDLPGDLGDGHAVRDGQVQLDLEPRVKTKPDPRLAEPDQAKKSPERTRGKPGDAVRAQGRGPNQVQHGLPGDQRATVCRDRWHAVRSSQGGAAGDYRA
jgi:hypothetical protein